MPKEDTQFKKGAPGRPKGIKNKFTTVKETVLAVFLDLQQQPKHSLTTFAKENPKDFYLIASKLIPNEVTGTLGFSGNLTIQPIKQIDISTSEKQIEDIDYE